MPFVFSRPCAGPHWAFSVLTYLSYYGYASAHAVVSFRKIFTVDGFAYCLLFALRFSGGLVFVKLVHCRWRKCVKELFRKDRDNVGYRFGLCVSGPFSFVLYLVMLSNLWSVLCIRYPSF